MMNFDNPNMTLEEAIEIIKEISPKEESTNSGRAESMILQAVHNGNLWPTEWINADDRLPDIGSTVLCLGIQGAMFVGHYNGTNPRGKKNKVTQPYGGWRSFRAWMPLPSPPQE